MLNPSKTAVLAFVTATSIALSSCGGSSGGGTNSGGGPTGSMSSGPNGPNGFGPGTGNPGIFAPPTSPTPTPGIDSELVSLSAIPNPLDIKVGFTRPLVVTGTFDDGSVTTLVNSSDVTLSFTPSMTSFVSVDSGGQVTAIGPGTGSILVSATINGVTRTTNVPTTTSYLLSYISDHSFDGSLTSNWNLLYENPVTVGSDTYPLIEVRNTYDPTAFPAQEGDNFLYLEVPSDSIGGISQSVNLPILEPGEKFILNLQAFAMLWPIQFTVEIVGSTTVTQTISIPALYTAPGVPFPGYIAQPYNIEFTELSGETVDVRFLATSPAPPTAPGAASMGLDDLALYVYPAYGP